jgi:glycosyltransferase involved in cell wall biosynthesis
VSGIPSQPAATVIIPTLDRPALLGCALTSALAQRGVALEAVVVDDGSIPALDRDGLGRDPRVVLLRHGSTRGMAAARNTGLRVARGKWVAFLDDDDAWAPDKLRRQIEEAQRTRAGFAYAGAIAVSPAGQVVARLAAPAPRDLYARLLERNVIPAGASNVIAQTGVVRNLGGFDEALPHLADWDMWIRLAAAATAAALPDQLVAYRHHAGNRSFSAADPLRADFEVLAARWAAARAQAGVTLNRADFERFLAWGPRHHGKRWHAARTYLAAALHDRNAGTALRGLGILLGEEAMRRGSRRPRPTPLPTWAHAYMGREIDTPG